MSFKKILGQNQTIQALRGFIKNNRVPRAMIFAGPAGVGKATTALEFAKTLNCLDAAANAAFDSCGLCQNCRHIDAGTHPDVIFANWQLQANLLQDDLEKQQNVRVETVRHLTNSSQQKAVLAKWKVYIIDNAERLMPAAANALLKFIEEPSPNTVWILVSSKKETMLGTIKSRCQMINFAPLPDGIVRNILEEDYVEAALAARAAQYGEGSVSKAKLAAELLGDFAGMEAGAAFAHQAADNLPKNLADARTSLNALLDMLAAAAHKKWLAAGVAAQDDKTRAALQDLLGKITFYKSAIGRNVSPNMIAQAALIEAEKTGITF